MKGSDSKGVWKFEVKVKTKRTRERKEGRQGGRNWHVLFIWNTEENKYKIRYEGKEGEEARRNGAGYLAWGGTKNNLKNGNKNK